MDNQTRPLFSIPIPGRVCEPPSGVTVMKATQNRRLIGYLVAPALAAVLGLGANVASADAVTPTGPFTASLCSGTKVTIKLGTATVTCTASTASSNASSSGSGQPICGATTPTLTGCTVSASGFTFSA